MATHKNYTFNYSEVSCITNDTVNGEFLWIAYKAKSGVCRIQKVSAHNLYQVYFEFSLSVNSINDIKVIGNYIYAAVTHSTIALYKISISNPLSSQVSILKSTLSINESPIAITSTASLIYVLTPGLLSGENAKVITFTSSGTYDETIDLPTVISAVSFVVDSNDEIWIITSANPAELYRVYFQSAEWIVEETILS